MKTHGDVLKEISDRAVRNGEIPYQSNRKAVQEIDIFHEFKEGREDLIVMLEGMDVYISDLEALSNAAGLVTKERSSSLR